MGKELTTSLDEASVVGQGAFSSVDVGPWVKGLQDRVNVVFFGTFVGTAILECSFDGGATVLPLTDGGGSVRQFTAPDRQVINEPEAGVLYRVRCTAWSSGTINWRLSK